MKKLLFLLTLLPITLALADVVKISDLPSASTPGDSDVSVLVQGGTTKKVTIAQILTNAARTDGSYSNPPWLAALAWSKITGVPSTAALLGLTNGSVIDAWGAKTVPAGTVVGAADSQALTNKTYNGLSITTSTGTLAITNGKTFSSSNSLSLAGTDGSTLNIGTGGTLGSAAYSASTDFASAAQGATADALNTRLLGTGTATITGAVSLSGTHSGLHSGTSSGLNTGDNSFATISQAQTGTDVSAVNTPGTTYPQIMAQADQKASLLFKTLGRFRGNETLRWLVCGDSFGYYGVPAARLWGDFGYGGMVNNTTAVLSGSSSIVYDQTIYPGSSLVRLRPGDNAVFPGSDATGNIVPPFGSIVKVESVFSASTGTFTISCDSQMGGSYSIVSTGTVNTNNGGSNTNTVSTFNIGSTDQRRIKLINTSTSDCYIISAYTLEASDSTAGYSHGKMFGINFKNFALGGSTPANWFASSQAQWNALVQDYDPHIVSLTSLETLADWQDPSTGFDAWVARMRIAAPNADLICVGQPPTAYGVRAGDADPINDYLRSRCAALGVLFIDPHAAFPDRTVRTMTDGVTTGTNTLISVTGSFTSADVGHTLQIQSGTTAINATDSTILAVLSSTSITTTGTWSGTGTGRTVYVGTSDPGIYVWPPHLGTNGTALENSRVYRCLLDTLSIPMAVYGGAQNNPKWGGGTQGFAIPQNLKLINNKPNSAAEIQIIQGFQSNPLTASGPGFGFGVPSGSFQWNSAFYVDGAGNGTSANLLVGQFGRAEIGVNGSGANSQASIDSISRPKMGHVELVNGYSSDGVAAVTVLNYSSTVPSLDFRTGATNSGTGTLATRIDNAGGLRFYQSSLGVTFSATNTITSGTGSPEGTLTAPVGSLFLNTSGGTGTTLYIKESGTGNTGWIAK